MSWWLPTYDYTSLGAVPSDSVVVGRRVCSSAEMFGAESFVDGSVNSDGALSSFEYLANTNPTLSIVILTILVAWCYMLFRYGRILSWSLKNLVSVSGALFMFTTTSMEFIRFIRMGIFINMLCTGAAISGFTAEGEAILWVFLCAVAAPLFVRIWALMWQGILKKFDFKASRWRDIRNLSNFDTALLSTVLAAPVIVILPIPGSMFFVICLFAVGYLYHILRIVYYFKSSKFSFLQSILYLCAVEITPVALVWGTVVYFRLL